uniref:Uncharacterized protein n=1 Tax=Oryza barthii TaxID=65489 RepID=A0A0D3G172_9ORYZ
MVRVRRVTGVARWIRDSARRKWKASMCFVAAAASPLPNPPPSAAAPLPITLGLGFGGGGGVLFASIKRRPQPHLTFQREKRRGEERDGEEEEDLALTQTDQKDLWVAILEREKKEREESEEHGSDTNVLSKIRDYKREMRKRVTAVYALLGVLQTTYSLTTKRQYAQSLKMLIWGRVSWSSWSCSQQGDPAGRPALVLEVSRAGRWFAYGLRPVWRHDMPISITTHRGDRAYTARHAGILSCMSGSIIGETFYATGGG